MIIGYTILIMLSSFGVVTLGFLAQIYNEKK